MQKYAETFQHAQQQHRYRPRPKIEYPGRDTNWQSLAPVAGTITTLPLHHRAIHVFLYFYLKHREARNPKQLHTREVAEN
jgi:hypothetical protein